MLTQTQQEELIEITRALVRIKSLSGQEEQAVRYVEKKMQELGYDQVTVDAMGNVLGRLGSGDKKVLFDSHLDTVAVNNPDEWSLPPFGGEIMQEKLYGRGSVDMKSGAAASIYAGALARQSGFISGRTIFVSCSVFEEDCEGENLKHLFTETGIRPGYVVICEPSNNQLALGHKGKAQVSIKTRGVSAHGATPDKGVNAIYAMAGIIQRVEKRNHDLSTTGQHGSTLVMSKISSRAASLNAVPYECEAYLDRRLAIEETDADIKLEMDGLVAGKDATWEIGSLSRKSWTGMEINYRPFHLAWHLDPDHELTRACKDAYNEAFGHSPGGFVFWDFSTNAVAPVSLGIPTIGFGPGDPEMAHRIDENCPLKQITDACEFYLHLMGTI